MKWKKEAELSFLSFSLEFVFLSFLLHSLLITRFFTISILSSFTFLGWTLCAKKVFFCFSKVPQHISGRLIWFNFNDSTQKPISKWLISFSLLIKLSVASVGFWFDNIDHRWIAAWSCLNFLILLSQHRAFDFFFPRCRWLNQLWTFKLIFFLFLFSSPFKISLSVFRCDKSKKNRLKLHVQKYTVPEKIVFLFVQHKTVKGNESVGCSVWC